MARRTPISIGELSFATASEAADAVRAVLYAYEPPARVSQIEHQLLLGDLLAMHPEAETKIGGGVDHFEVRVNLKTPGFWIIRVDGSETDFSFIKALRPPDHATRVRMAMRRAVVDQVLAVRDEVYGDGETVACPITGERVTKENCHVDHYDPPFIELADRFAEGEGGYEQIGVVTADGAIGTNLSDEDVTRRWQDFHREHAKLRVVSARANLSLLRRGGTGRT
jgi:hypothetical protein